MRGLCWPARLLQLHLAQYAAQSVVREDPVSARHRRGGDHGHPRDGPGCGALWNMSWLEAHAVGTVASIAAGHAYAERIKKNQNKDNSAISSAHTL